MWKFVGEGSYLVGVPARDLTDEEYAEYAARFEEREGVKLEATGMYVQDKKSAAKAATSEGE